MRTVIRWTGWAGVLVAGLMAAGCRADASPDAGSLSDLENLDPGDQIVVFWYPYTDRQEEVLSGLIDTFNTSNEWGITVIGEHAGSPDAIYARIGERLGSDALPEIVAVAPYQIADYAARGALANLTPYVESPAWGFSQEALEDQIATGDELPQFDGRFGLPFNRSLEVLYYNVDWLHELGYDHPPLTMEEFREMACAASDAGTGLYGYELSIDAATFADWLYNQNGDMLAADGTAYAFGGRFGLNTFTLMQELFEQGCATLEQRPHDDQADFGRGKTLFTIDSTARLLDYHRAVDEGAGFNWSISTLPTTLDTPQVMSYGASLSLVPTSPERQLASWLFIKWLTEAPQSVQWFRTSNHLPIRQSAAAAMVDDLATRPLLTKAWDLLSLEIVAEPNVTGYGVCRDAIGQAMASAVNGEDAAIALIGALEACNTSLETPAR